jgi:hypothetical protein
MKYMLLFCSTEEDRRAFEAMTPEALQAQLGRVLEWQRRHGDRILSSARLAPRESATTVRRENGKPLVTDGPFMEGKEELGGYVMVEVDDLDAALAIAKEWPAGPVEVRPVMDMP